MSHIHQEPGQHDATVSAFIIRTDGPEPRILLHEHRKLNRLFQFGGHVELHETPWQAIAHEIEEESGYRLDQLRLLQPADRLMELSSSVLHPQPVCQMTHQFSDHDHFHTDTVYAFITDQTPAHEVGEGESGLMRLVTRAELSQLNEDTILPDIKDIGLYILDSYLQGSEEVSVDAY
ncbi:NTP pyrophosphohydrolase, partial [Candidatus Saccharibacteria bacterium]